MKLSPQAATQAEALFTRIKEAILPESPFASGLAPAFAGAIPPARPLPEPQSLPNTFQFSTHGIQGRGTISRDITDWNHVDVLKTDQDMPHGDGWRCISLTEAQKEVARLLNGRAPCHEYIAYEAAQLCSSQPKVSRYMLHIVVGAAAEDFTFAPGESFENLYASQPKRSFSTRKEITETVVPNTSRLPSFMQGIFTIASRFWLYVTKGETEKDQLNRPYFAHFYDPSRQDDDRGLSLAGGEVRFQTAKERAKMYWRLASEYYAQNDLPKAFCALGHMVHLISDMQVPAHVHNDIHGPNVILGKPDSLERWLARADYKHPARKPKDANIRMWGGKQAGDIVPDHSWYERNVFNKIDALIEKAVSEAQAFRSVDKPGTRPDQGKTGPLSDDECFQQANHLIPGAIAYSAQIIANFVDYHERGGRLKPPGWAPPKTT